MYLIRDTLGDSRRERDAFCSIMVPELARRVNRMAFSLCKTRTRIVRCSERSENLFFQSVLLSLNEFKVLPILR